MKTTAENETTPPRIVLVGACKGDQLKNWPGWHRLPMETLKVEGSKVEGSANGKDALRENLAQSPQSSQREFGPKENLSASASLLEEKSSRTSRTSREEIPFGLQHVTNEGPTDNPAQSPQSSQSGLGANGNLCVPASLREEKSSRSSRTSREEIPSGLQSVTELRLFKKAKDAA